MARQRFIKPGFFLHGELYDAEAASGLPLRVAFAGLWCQADRRGVFRCKPRELKAAVLPYDPCDFSAVLDALEAAGFITRYVVDGKQYGCIPTMEKHQTFHRDEKPSSDPGPDAAQGQHGASTVPAQGQHADPTLPYPIAVDGGGTASAPCPHRAEHHREAWAYFHTRAANKPAFRAEVLAVIQGMPGHGPGFGEQVVGQALHEIAASDDPAFTPNRLRAFCRKIRDRKPERPPVQLVSNDKGVMQPAVKQPDGSWRYLTDDEARALGWSGEAA